MDFAADTFGRWQLALRAPGKQPGPHVFVPDVVAGLHLAVGLAHLCKDALLIGDVGFDGIGNQKIGAAARGFRQLGEAALGFGLEAYAERSATCVRHEHSIAHRGRTGLKTGDYRYRSKDRPLQPRTTVPQRSPTLQSALL